MSNELQIEEVGKTWIVRFTRPEIRNPLSVIVLDQLHEIVDKLAVKGNTEGVIFTGIDSVFASGADLREIANITHKTAADFARRGQDLMAKIAALSQTTTIAAINGYCFGGALDLTLACDWRIASANAKFAHPGAGLGIITGWGGTQRLPRLVGSANAMEMFFTAEPVTSEHALRIGLIDEISDDIIADSMAYLSGDGSSNLV